MDENEKTPGSRRNLLKALAAGGGVAVSVASLPKTWSRPQIDSVLLPAHAQTTDTEEPPEGSERQCRGGCFERTDTTGSVFWDSESETATFFTASGCEGAAPGATAAVVADSISEAESSLPCSEGILLLNDFIALTDCTVYFCD